MHARAGQCASLAALVALATACTQTDDPARFNPETVLYDGEPYGDFLILADAVRRCMQSDKQALPRMILLERNFDCYTTAGWQEVFGCTGDDKIFMAVPHLIETKGALWSHELTHYFGANTEDSPCGFIAIEGFSIDQPDAGP